MLFPLFFYFFIFDRFFFLASHIDMAPVLDSGVFTAPHASAAVSLNDICFSSACVQTAASLLQSMDMNIDPCSDFYQYTCKIK